MSRFKEVLGKSASALPSNHSTSGQAAAQIGGSQGFYCQQRSPGDSSAVQTLAAKSLQREERFGERNGCLTIHSVPALALALVALFTFEKIKKPCDSVRSVGTVGRPFTLTQSRTVRLFKLKAATALTSNHCQATAYKEPPRSLPSTLLLPYITSQPPIEHLP